MKFNLKSIFQRFAKRNKDTHDKSNLVIETPRLVLRELEPDDAKRILAISNVPGFVYYCFDGSKEKVEAFMKKAADTRQPEKETGQRKHVLLAITLKDTKEMIGVVSLESFHFLEGFDREINFFVDPAYQSKGYGGEAAVNMMHYGYSQMGISGFNVTIHPKNGPSLAVAKKQGATQVTETEINTVRGKEPRLVLSLTKDVFYAMRAKDKKPLILPPASNDNPPKKKNKLKFWG